MKSISASFLFTFAWLAGYSASANEFLKLAPSDAKPEDHFGSSVGISGNMAIVGAARIFESGTGSGSAYLFDVTTGNQLSKLLPSDAIPNNRFGRSVGISGTTAIVGDVFDDDNGIHSGSAYLFDSTTGTQLAKLVASDGAEDDHFGVSVDVSGSIAIVGAFFDDDNGNSSGSAYLFDTSTGNELAKLTPLDGSTSDQFGRSVGISGNLAIVGSPGDDDNGDSSGSAYLFDVTTGSQLAKLTPDDGSSGDVFGYAVGISGSTVVVGAWAGDGNRSRSGSAYLFDAITGSQLSKLIASDGTTGDDFGSSVAISGNRVIIGASDDSDSGWNSGSAYLFDVSSGMQLAKYTASDGAVFDQLGHSVAVSGNTTIAGSFRDDDNGADSGSAYLFKIPEPSTMFFASQAFVVLFLRRTSIRLL